MDTMHCRSLSRRWVAAVIVLAALTTGCSLGSRHSAAVNKAGAANEVTLKLLSPDGASLDNVTGVKAFVEATTRLSHGRIRIDVVGGPQVTAFEHAALKDTTAGRYDLAWTGTRSLDTIGVRSFQPLQAPMLVDSVQLERRILHSNIPAEILRGLDHTKLLGLALYAGRLRLPIGVNHPFLGPSDFRGATVRTFESRVQEAALRTIGARVVVADPVAALRAGVLKGRISGFENDLVTYTDNGYETIAPYLTANVALWPRTVVLLANRDRFSRLPTADRNILRRAASIGVAASIPPAGSDARLLRTACINGARVRLASSAQLKALRTAFSPATRRLEGDPFGRRAITQIEALKSHLSTSPTTLPTACEKKSGVTKPPPTTTRTFPIGDFRTIVSAKTLIARGSTPDDANSNAGVWTMHIAPGGLWTQHFVPADPSKPALDYAGTLSTSGNHVTLTSTAPAEYAGLVEVFAWRVTGDAIKFTVVDSPYGPNNSLYAPSTWVRAA